MEHVIRQTVIALRLGDLLGLDQQERTVLYYSGLLAWVGCHTDAYEQAKWFGDDIDFKREALFADENLPALGRLLVTRLGSGRSPTERVRTGLAFPGAGATLVRPRPREPLADHGPTRRAPGPGR